MAADPATHATTRPTAAERCSGATVNPSVASHQPASSRASPAAERTATSPSRYPGGTTVAQSATDSVTPESVSVRRARDTQPSRSASASRDRTSAAQPCTGEPVMWSLARGPVATGSVGSDGAPTMAG